MNTKAAPARHGYVAYTNGCRCDTCKQAKADYMRNRRAEARQKARSRTGDLHYHLAEGVTHGTFSAHEEAGCRCQPCTDAKRTKWQREGQAKGRRLGRRPQRDELGLTPRQRDVLNALVTHVDDHGYVPSHYEIAARAGLSSETEVSRYLRWLEAAGWVQLNGRGRRLTLLKRPEVTL